MSASADCSISWAKENTYGTFVTPTRSTEFITESLGWPKPQRRQRMRVGSIVDRASRTVVTSASGAGDIDMLLASRGLGLLWEAFCGNSVNNLVSGPRTSSSTSWHQPGTAVPAGRVQRGTNTIDPLVHRRGSSPGSNSPRPTAKTSKIKSGRSAASRTSRPRRRTPGDRPLPGRNLRRTFAFRTPP